VSGGAAFFGAEARFSPLEDVLSVPTVLWRVLVTSLSFPYLGYGIRGLDGRGTGDQDWGAGTQLPPVAPRSRCAGGAVSDQEAAERAY
jgi:hypothetical protein